MQSLWNDNDAKQHQSLRSLRVYSSRLLGSDANLVLHGGGNTSVKETVTDLFGNQQQILTVKGSGWDLGSIEEAGFAPVKMEPLLAMVELESLSDSDMVSAQRAAMIDPDAPNPSIEAILHALIPFTFVDHSHADAIVTITNTPNGEALIRKALNNQGLGDKILVVPYVMPGFILAKTIHEMTQNCNWQELEGMVLMNHGLFTFANDAKSSYEKHIELVTRAEDFLTDKGAVLNLNPVSKKDTDSTNSDLLTLAKIRQAVSKRKGQAVFARLNNSDLAIQFSQLNLDGLPNPGPLTPEHVIRTKIFGLPLEGDLENKLGNQLDKYEQQYQQYFQAHAKSETCLNPAPNYAIWPDLGAIAFGKSPKETAIIEDLNQHTFEAILRAEHLGGYQALSGKHLFEIEYWELEQAKLKKGGSAPALSGKTVLICEADTPFRQACAESLQRLGAEVVICPETDNESLNPNTTSETLISILIEKAVRRCGGIDALVLNMELEGSLELLRLASPFLQLGIDPSIVCLNLNVQETVKLPGSEVRINKIQNPQQGDASAVARLTAELISEASFDNAAFSL